MDSSEYKTLEEKKEQEENSIHQITQKYLSSFSKEINGYKDASEAV